MIQCIISYLVNNEHVVLDSRRNERIQECLKLVKLVSYRVTKVIWLAGWLVGNNLHDQIKYFHLFKVDENRM
jgi:hypothetical protein